MKICSRCKNRKRPDCFSKDKSGKDGYCAQCKLCRREYRRRKAIDTAEYNKKYQKQNVDRIKEIKYEYRIKNKNKSNQQSKLWRQNNAKTVKQYKNLPEVKIANRLRTRTYNIVKGKIKSGSVVKDLGCSIEFLKQYLEDKFYPRAETGETMSWENYGLSGWHIDHIIPLSSFNLSVREQFLKAAHYTNLRPLWAEENLRKGNKI